MANVTSGWRIPQLAFEESNGRRTAEQTDRRTVKSGIE